MTNAEIINEAKRKFFYKHISPYYYGVKAIKAETVKEITHQNFIKRIDKIMTESPKNGDLVRVDGVTVKCFYNQQSEVILIIIK